ncbi:MAG TPA: hypothetical protein VGO00_05610, partial [Kofleriaceae bacterium]|nr:hypothetical protein [Kofleriaceae bacterium]
MAVPSTSPVLATQGAAINPHKPGQTKPPAGESAGWRSYLGVFKFSRRAIRLVWSTNRAITITLALGSLVGGLLPSGVAYVGKLLINSILAAS